MFFEVLQPRVDNLLHTEHLAAKQVFDIIDMPVCVGKPDVDGAGKIIQTLIANENADKHGESGEGRRGESRHQLIRNDH